MNTIRFVISPFRVYFCEVVEKPGKTALITLLTVAIIGGVCALILVPQGEKWEEMRKLIYDAYHKHTEYSVPITVAVSILSYLGLCFLSIRYLQSHPQIKRVDNFDNHTSSTPILSSTRVESDDVGVAGGQQHTTEKQEDNVSEQTQSPDVVIISDTRSHQRQYLNDRDGPADQTTGTFRFDTNALIDILNEAVTRDQDPMSGRPLTLPTFNECERALICKLNGTIMIFPLFAQKLIHCGQIEAFSEEQQQQLRALAILKGPPPCYQP